MSTYEHFEPKQPIQSFEGKLHTTPTAILLHAEMGPGDRIIVSGNQDYNPALLEVAGQTTLAAIGLSNSDAETAQGSNHEPTSLSLVRVDKPEAPEIQEVLDRANKEEKRTGNYFLMLRNPDGSSAIAFIPDSTKHGYVAKKSNLEWMSYPFAKQDSHNPIDSEHEVVVGISDGDVYFNTVKGRFKVLTRASQEHIDHLESKKDKSNDDKELPPRGIIRSMSRALRSTRSSSI